jgi:peptide-methionine (S)-S-oxide reductase
MTERATFAGGCFWGVEAAFRRVPGVTATRVGYTGGHTVDPTYRQVCTRRTGHAEAVEVEFDPARVSYDDLLEIFFASHNPASRNRQGLDFGSQYRSAIFFHDAGQEAAARAAAETAQGRLRWPRRVTTQIVAAPTFYPAEEHHQRYLEKRGRATCTVDLATGELEPAKRS